MSRVYRALEKAEKEKQQKIKAEPLLGIFEEGPIPSKEEQVLKDIEIGNERLELPVREEEPIPIAPLDTFAAEQFRKLKTHIFRNSPNSMRLILITSAVPQEGKTTVTLNLAMAISQEIHKRIILIDADLRKPSIYPEKYTYRKGLSDYLADQTPIKEIMKNFETEKFMIIPAGKPSPKAAELVASKKMKDLLSDLRELGEDTYILIDSPPILATSEPLQLSEWVDGVILVVMSDRAPKGSIRKAAESIGRKKIIGVVFNQKDLKTSKYYTDYYYRYYKK